MKRPKRIIGAMVVVLDDIKNRAGDTMERGEIVEIYQSFRGYGLKTQKNGRTIYINRVSHYDIRFLKDGNQD